MSRKDIKVGVKQGDGPPPGFSWNVWVLEIAYRSARRFLSQDQYDHLVEQVQELARHDDPTHSEVVDVRPMKNEHFWEIRDKGGVLGSLNVRVFFGRDNPRRALVILGAVKKQNDGATKANVVVRMRRRLRKYTSGDYGYCD